MAEHVNKPFNDEEIVNFYKRLDEQESTSFDYKDSNECRIQLLRARATILKLQKENQDLRE